MVSTNLIIVITYDWADLLSTRFGSFRHRIIYKQEEISNTTYFTFNEQVYSIKKQEI